MSARSLFAILATFFLFWKTEGLPEHRYELDPFPFEYGIASGDPTSDSILLWTRATSQPNITWAIWLPESGNFSSPFKTGVVNILPANDFTITIDVSGLQPRTNYEYGFESLDGTRSRIGKTKTAPAQNDTSFTSMRIATFSCACHWCGFLNAYKEMARDESIDLVIGLGDWLYPTPYITTGGQCNRVPKGLCYDGACTKEEETIDVADIPAQTCSGDEQEEMRHFHKILNTDVDARELRAMKPMINIPDNHDIDDVQTVEFEPQIRAWFEWVPTRYEVRDGLIFFPRLYRNTGSGETPPSYLGKDQIDFLEHDVFGAGNKTEGWRIMCSSQVFMPWAIQEEGYKPLILGILIGGVFTPMMLSVLFCSFIRFRRYKKGKKEDKEILSLETPKEIEEDQNDQSLKRRCNRKSIIQCCDRCCLSNLCMLFTLVLMGLVVYGQQVVIGGIESRFAILDNNPTGVANIQQERDRAWDGGNQADRAELLSQMKRLDAKNNVFISGDMHISLASNVVDTSPGVGPKETTPEETTNFGVEFLSSSVSKGNLNEYMQSWFGIRGTLLDMLLPLAQFFFEHIFYESNTHLKYFETVQHGYGLMDVKEDKIDFQWRWQDYSIAGASSRLARKMTLKKNENKWAD